MNEKPPADPAIVMTEIPLPPDRAFVVQLRRRPAPGGELFVGRVEHIASGEVARFDSAAGLITFIARVGSRGGSHACVSQMQSRGKPNDPKGSTKGEDRCS